MSNNSDQWDEALRELVVSRDALLSSEEETIPLRRLRCLSQVLAVKYPLEEVSATRPPPTRSFIPSPVAIGFAVALFMGAIGFLQQQYKTRPTAPIVASKHANLAYSDEDSGFAKTASNQLSLRLGAIQLAALGSSFLPEERGDLSDRFASDIGVRLDLPLSQIASAIEN